MDIHNNQISQAVGEILRYVKDHGYTVSKNKLAPIVTFARIAFNEDICISNTDDRDKWILNKIKLGLLVGLNKKHKKAKPSTKTNIETRKSYKLFLKGNYWKETSAMILKRDNYSCVKCGSKKRLQVHHKTYEHHLDEKNNLQDLITLCHKCHKKEHGL